MFQKNQKWWKIHHMCVCIHLGLSTQKIRKFYIPLAIYSNTWNYFQHISLFFTRGNNHKFFPFLVCNFLISFLLLTLTSVWMDIYIYTLWIFMFLNVEKFVFIPSLTIHLFVCVIKNCYDIFRALATVCFGLSAVLLIWVDKVRIE